MLRRNLLGVVSLCAGVLIFSLQDAIIKEISGAHAVTLAVAIRGVVAIPILLALVHWEAGLGALRSRRFWPLTARAAVLFVSYTAYYMAFPALPLADAVALYFTVPLFITAMAGPFLGEVVGARAWIAVAAGFAGVLIMLQPGSAVFEPAALLSLLSAFMYASSMLMARRLGTQERASVMAFYQNWVYVVGACGTALVVHLLGIHHASHPSLAFLVREWDMPSWRDLMLMGTCGVIAAIAMTLLTHAYRVGEASVVGSFEYTGILWAPLWGFLFFGEVPRWTTFLGGALIVGAGLVALRGTRSGQPA
jgi:drug/metabolite transporter (DMT)-like permease